MRNLFTASGQWASRPQDERFGSLGSMLRYAKQKREIARVAKISFDKFGVEAHDGNVVLTKGSKHIGFTNWAFTQYCARVGAPPSFLSKLPAENAVADLRYMLKNNLDVNKDYKVLFNQTDEGHTVRAFNGTKYSRVWDYQIVERLTELLAKGWDVPPAYGGSPSGLYCGDRDMFAFMVNDKNRIKDGTDEGLAHGFFCGNSEVGAASYWITTFLYRFVCGNHIVWGVKDVKKIRIRHVGDADQKVMAALATQLAEYAEQSARPLEASIKKAQTYELGDSDEAVEDRVYNARILPRKTIRAALAEARQFEDIDGSPWSAWGLAQGVSRISQTEEIALNRVTKDLATGKILTLVN
jgi:hypothetical protein